MLDGAHLGEREMDPGLGRVAEPGVVGHVDDHLGLAVVHRAVDEAGQDVLVADERGHRVPGQRDRLDRCARRQVARVRRPVVEHGKRLAERKVLAERQRIVLVVATHHVTLGVGGERDVVGAAKLGSRSTRSAPKSDGTPSRRVKSACRNRS